MADPADTSHRGWNVVQRLNREIDTSIRKQGKMPGRIDVTLDEMGWLAEWLDAPDCYIDRYYGVKLRIV